MYKKLLPFIFIVAIISFCSFKKKKLDGTWRESITSYDVRDTNEIKFLFWRDEFVFESDSTGTRKKDIEQRFMKSDRTTTSRGYEILFPFKYKTSHDDTGNLVEIQYGQGELLKVRTLDSIANREKAFTEVEKSSNSTEKFYYHIRPDSNDKMRLSLQFMQPGTNKLSSFGRVTEQYEKKIDKKTDKIIKKSKQNVRK